MFEKHIEAYYNFLTKQLLTEKFSVVKRNRKTINLFAFGDLKWILLPEQLDEIKEEDIEDYIKKEPQVIRFIDKTDFEDIKNKELCRKLTVEDKELFEEFHNSCSNQDKEEGMVSLDDPVVYGCIVDNKIVSVTSLWHWGDRLSDIGILSHPEYRHRGYAKSVCQTMMSDIDRLFIWRCDYDNAGSNKLALSIGFIEMGESYILEKVK